MIRTLVLAAFLPLSALAQLQLFQYDGTTEKAVGQTLDIGSAAPGSNIETRFRVRNSGVASVSLTNLSLTGASFQFSAKPSLPFIIAPASLVDFKVLFSPGSTGTYSAALLVNSISVTLRGTAVGALTQLQLFQFDGTTEKTVGQLYDVGTAAPGDSIETRFRLRNAGVAPATLNNLSVVGTSFRLSAQPSLGYIIAPGAFVDFRVMFSPGDLGSFSANLLVNTLSVTLHGTAVASAVLMLGSTKLAAGTPIDFGQTELGTSLPLTLMLSNPSLTSVAVSSIAITGPDFSGPIGVAAPLALSPGQSVAFMIKFAPTSARSSQGVLKVDQRSFSLVGLGVNPPLPKASIQFDSSAGISGRQARVSIQLASSSRVAGTGTLTMDFKSSIQGATDDPAIQFLSGPKHNATVTIGVGDAIAKFGSSVDLAFQTGSTAGTITFTLKLPNDTQQATFVIPSGPVFFDTTTATRRVNDLDVSLIGFDNTHSAAQLTFTFYDKTGKVLQPGAIRVDETADFRRYFDTSAVGGSFQLRATFPVAGDATQVAGVDVEMTNTAGVTKTERIVF